MQDAAASSSRGVKAGSNDEVRLNLRIIFLLHWRYFVILDFGNLFVLLNWF
jgi:hypothetical protein